MGAAISVVRRRIPELMDDPGVDPRAHDHALRSLNRANRIFGFDRRLAVEIQRLGPLHGLSVLDLGAGGGGLLAYLPQRAESGAGRLLVGLDRSHYAASCARSWNGGDIRHVVGDARRIPVGDGVIDVVTCSLSLHHFDPPEVESILREIDRVAQKGAVICDLSRSWLAWVATWLVTRIMSRSRIFHVDGPRSVRAAFRAGELAAIAQRAGLEGVRIRRCFPFRLILTWKKREPRDAD